MLPTLETRATIETIIHLHPGKVTMTVKESRKASLLAQDFEHLKPVDKWEVLVVPMKVYDLVLGLPWWETQKLTAAKVNWQPCECHMDRKGRWFQQ